MMKKPGPGYKTSDNMQDIEIKWATQLAKEHRNIAWRYGTNLTTPVINISSGRKTLGSWSDRHKTLSISSHLIKNEIWDIVLEVLKHEMAHQYVSELYDNSDIHGKYFKTACAILGVHPAFIAGRMDYQKKLQLFKGELPADALKMHKRVKKLMALGQSGNAAEAQSASRKANYLLNKYNLQHINSSDENPDIKYLTICHKKKRIESIQRAILSILNNHYYVNCVTSDTYHAGDHMVYKCIVLVGQNESLTVAEYVYHFLLDRCKTLWLDFKKKNKAKRGEKISFDMGFIAGIEHNHKTVLENSDGKNKKNASLPVKTIALLMEKKQQNNQIEISRLFPKLKKIKYGRHQAASGAFQGGLKNGKNTHINKSMTFQKKGIAGLLES